MAYSEATAARIRALVGSRAGFREKRMFGGVGFLRNGNMCCGVWREDLILRIGPAAYEELRGHPDVKEFDVTGRPMTGWIMVKPRGFDNAEALEEWVELAVRFVGTLAPKEEKAVPSRMRR